MKRAEFRGFRAETQTNINRNAVIVEQHRVEVGHVAAVVPAENAAHALSPSAAASFQPSVTSMPLIRWTIRSPPTPVPYSFQQRQRAKRYLLNGIFGASLSQVSQSRFCGERSGGGGYSHAPVGSLRPSVSSTIVDVADGALPLIKFAGLGAEHGTDALRADLHDAIIFLRCGDHLEALGDGVRHGLFAVDVFAGVAGIDDDALVPVVGNGGDDAVDIFAVEQFLIVARGGQDWDCR